VRRRRNPYYSGPVSENFDGLRFHGRVEPPDKRPGELVRMLLAKRRQPWPKTFPSPHQDIPPERIDDLRVALIGHASFLIQIAGLNILVDPVWADRVSPVGFAGPKRVNPPGIRFDDLPPIDAILITHNHYDHLDVRTVARLWQRFKPRVIAPLGNEAVIRSRQPEMVVETHNWGDRVVLSDRVHVHLTPAYHWSARAIRDRRMALWCAYVLTTPDGGVLYHVGDTGYGDGRIFRAVREEFGAPSIALLPIGAYEPRWFMRAQHVDPEEAVRIMLDCGAERAFGHHWGTFRLTEEPIEDPPAVLAQALDLHGVEPERFQPMRPGQSFEMTWS
jgi:L-ascorbate metabolism protein UlaG (beta-lactamase superfamily)